MRLVEPRTVHGDVGGIDGKGGRLRRRRGRDAGGQGQREDHNAEADRFSHRERAWGRSSGHQWGTCHFVLSFEGRRLRMTAVRLDLVITLGMSRRWIADGEKVMKLGCALQG